MQFVNGQTVTLNSTRFKMGKFKMTVLGQVGKQVALYDSNNCIRVFSIEEYKGKQYLCDVEDGGSCDNYDVKFE